MRSNQLAAATPRHFGVAVLALVAFAFTLGASCLSSASDAPLHSPTANAAPRLLCSAPGRMIALAASEDVSTGSEDETGERAGDGVVVNLLNLYRGLLSPVLGTRCPMHPSCSQYAKECVKRHGALKGLALAADRVLRCGNDREMYETVIISFPRARLSDHPPE